MRACIRRGSHQIGGSCVELEHDGKRLVLDLGLPLDAETNNPSLLPEGLLLEDSDSPLLGILISHAHLDHYGLLAHVPTSIPVGMGPAARRIIRAASPFMLGGWPVPSPGWDYESGRSFDIGPFNITPYLVDHSAYDAYALLIEAGGERLFYSGDFRGHGRKSALFDCMLSMPPHSLDTLLIEGSSLSRLDDNARFPSEAELEQRLTDLLLDTRGLALCHSSAQNIDRLVTLQRAARRSGRHLVIDLYTAAILEATGNPRLPQSHWPDLALYVPHRQRLQIKRLGIFDLLARHSRNRIYIEDLCSKPEQYVLLFRPLHQPDLEQAACLDHAHYVFSQWEGYWERGGYKDVQRWIEAHQIPVTHLHTSGHASPIDLRHFMEALAPSKVVPIHSCRPDRYVDLFDRVEPRKDGIWWPVAEGGTA